MQSSLVPGKTLGNQGEQDKVFKVKGWDYIAPGAGFLQVSFDFIKTSHTAIPPEESNYLYTSGSLLSREEGPFLVLWKKSCYQE